MPAAAIIGIIGSILFIVGFGALNFGILKSDSIIYQLCNLVGALAFTYTALKPFNTGLFITEAAWALIGVYGLYTIAKTQRNKASRAA